MKSLIVPRQARGIQCVKSRVYVLPETTRLQRCTSRGAVPFPGPSYRRLAALGRKKFGGHDFRVSFVGTMKRIWRWKGAGPYRKEISVDLTIHAVSTGRAFLISAVHENAVSADIVDALL